MYWRSLKEIREFDLKCECNIENTQIEDLNCVNCIADSSRNIFASNYNKCPEVTRQITEKEHAKWFNSELCEAKKKKRRMEDKWKRKKQKRIMNIGHFIRLPEISTINWLRKQRVL